MTKGTWVGAGVVALVAAAFGVLVVRAQGLPSGPVDLAWDKVACAHCRMHVGERGFAAQLQLTDGRVLAFDDPGCLMGWLDQSAPPPEVHATWLHHHTEDRWLARTDTAFVPVTPTPMGFGLAAVAAGTPGALTWDDAAARVRGQRSAR